jgi:hypothetical protein
VIFSVWSKIGGLAIMDVGKALTFITEDERWVNKVIILLIVSFFSFLIIPIFFLIGYAIGITRNVKDGVEKPLPEWENWGQLFMDGLYIFIAQFVYTLPFLIIACIAMVATGGLGALADPGGNSDAMAALVGTTGLIIGCLGFLYVIALIFISPAIIIQYVLQNDDFGACFRFGQVFGIARDSIADIFIVVLVMIGIGFAVSMVTGVLSLIPCIGWIAALLIGLLASPYLTAVSGHLYGQIATNFLSGKQKFV